MLKIYIEYNSLSKDINECILIDEKISFIDVFYHRNLFPNYRMISLEVLLPIELDEDKFKELKLDYQYAINKMYNTLKYTDEKDINDNYLRSMVIQYLDCYKLPYK